ncbi:MAG: hypothetical protein ACP5D2_03745, partial [Candidatus Nanoarchaeia archaeon]
DKTGTLTKNEMSVTKLYFNKEMYDANEVKLDKHSKRLIECAAFCNNVRQGKEGYIGDQTEITLKKFSDRF